MCHSAGCQSSYEPLFFLYAFIFSNSAFINKSSSFFTLCNPAISNRHRSIDVIIIMKTEKDSTCHIKFSLINTTFRQPLFQRTVYIFSIFRRNHIVSPCNLLPITIFFSSVRKFNVWVYSHILVSFVLKIVCPFWLQWKNCNLIWIFICISNPNFQ